MLLPFFGYNNSLSARDSRRLLPRAPGPRSSQLNVTKTRTNGRSKRTGAHTAPPVENVAWLPVGINSAKFKCSSVSLMQARP